MSKYHRKPDKVLGAEHVIKDVCAACNSGPLSALDDYARSLYFRFFAKRYQSIKRATFEYDFDKLSKWLLKIGYNSARAAGASDANVFSQYASGIIGSSRLPASVGFSVSLLGQLISVNATTRSKKVTELIWCRVGSIGLSLSEPPIVGARTVIINSWQFRILVAERPEMTVTETDLARAVLRGVVLLPDSSSTKVPTIPENPEGLMHHYRDKQHLYEARRHQG